MAKRPAYLSKKKMTGQGISKKFADRAVWRGESAPEDVWATALIHLDDHGDKTPLLELLKSNCEIPSIARLYLADLIKRGVAEQKGRRRTPLYMMSMADARIHMALKAVREYIDGAKMSRAQAVAKAAADYELDPKVLNNANEGRRGAARTRLKALSGK
jgi:hypothetical protein